MVVSTYCCNLYIPPLPLSEYKQRDAATAIAKTLNSRGIGSPEPIPFTDEEIKKYYNGVRIIFILNFLPKI